MSMLDLHNNEPENIFQINHVKLQNPLKEIARQTNGF